MSDVISMTSPPLYLQLIYFSLHKHSLIVLKKNFNISGSFSLFSNFCYLVFIVTDNTTSRKGQQELDNFCPSPAARILAYQINLGNGGFEYRRHCAHVEVVTLCGSFLAKNLAKIKHSST